MKFDKLIFFLILFASCANPLPPSGGPADKTPPEIVSSDPVNGTTNWNAENITLEFSKYMNKILVIENLSISPIVKMNFDWSGKELEIEFEEPLDTNTTYALILGTEYTDIRNNTPLQSYSLIFSTGPKIDSGKISGKLFDSKPEGAFIFAYKLNNINPDTLNPLTTIPDYKTQVGNSGLFTIPALKDGKYRLIAVRDKFKDGIYNEGLDQFGSAESDVIVANGKSSSIQLKLGPTIDSQKPLLYEVEAFSNERINAFFSEEIDTLSINKSLFIISDSSGLNQQDEPISAYISSIDGKSIEIITTKKLDIQKKYQLKVIQNSYYQIRDTAGNTLSDTANKVFFVATSDKDTLIPALYRINIKDSIKAIPTDQRFKLIFNTAVNKLKFENKISIFSKQDEKSIEYELFWMNDNILDIIPKQNLKQDTWYLLTIQFDSVRSLLGNLLKDTIYKINFKTEDKRNYGGVSGKISNPTLCNGNYIVILKSRANNKELTTMASTDGTWHFDEVAPGDYTIEIYCDSNGDQSYSYGNSFPFSFSEKFFLFEKPITVKPRWKVEGVILIVE